MRAPALSACLVGLLATAVRGFVAPGSFALSRTRNVPSLRMVVETETKRPAEVAGEEPDAAETTEKYGLEAGLFSVFKSKKGGRGEQAKELLKRYGSAYLLTSISLAIVSFTACYVAVDSGVDVAALLSKVGIDTSAATEQAGTVAIAYAVHKAASPIRFPPTVALTPLVAKWLGREDEARSDAE